MLGEDNNLEEFFRKGTSRYDVEFNEADWKKMEAKLDEELLWRATVRKKVIRASAGIVLLLMLGVTGYLVFTGNDSVDKNLTTEQVTRSVESDEGKLIPLDATTKALNAIDQGQGMNNKTNDDDVAHTNDSYTLKRDNDENTQQNFRTSPNSSTASSGRNNVGDKSLTGSATVSSKSKPESSRDDARSDAGLNTKVASAEPQREPIGSGVKKGPSSTGVHENGSVDPLTDSVSAVSRAVDTLHVTTEQPSDDTKDEEKNNIWERGMLNVALVYAPDFSATGMNGFMAPGHDVGVLAQYQVLNRLYVSTGAIWSTKKYWGYGTEYNPPEGYWGYRTNGVVPDKVDGHCHVWEIPISVTYDVYQSERARLYVSAGVSSYLMKGEKYKYTFNDPNPGSAMGWETDKSSNYSMAIGGFSIGYDWVINRNFSFSIEPFVKVPFEELGWANIDLYTTGVMLSGRYWIRKKE